MEARQRLEARLAKSDVAWDWQVARGPVTTAVVGGSSLHDLIIISHATRQRGTTGAPLPIVEDIIMTASCGVLVVPAGVDRFDANAPAVVAWNASPEAAAAVRRALPLLKLASNVYIVSVGEDEDEFPQTAACVYLSRHGIQSELQPLPQTGYSTAETLMKFADDHRAAMIVMGAYGHSRLREILLGGATRDMLAKSKVPMLMGT